ncbi:hypothetical protein [Comamonas thiooxydans]|uniref:Uncharacterized protein n=1 Tax=Comamonas thiooxydans TaxID=363952 RepID=A0A0E3BUH3_9BURK|nr:hypothetical protein [Comamonas thiooxydans]KGH11569.1 hypothetical protein P608_13305 [Comamonas thiooxydans]KGH21172.1 hypothetical protein P607_08710 [Comamonas thiooxydans]KGH24580.1 hypothetical protein P606_08610 [Comamonas thiooxydans]OAD83793.1 hypothetical protein ATN89_14040 [Comamonas thiooxydans]
MQRLAWLRVLQRSRPASRFNDSTRHHGLTHAVISALSERRTDVLRHLVDRHAAPLMASAMANLSIRQRADALSLLTREQRSRIDNQLRASQAQQPWTRLGTSGKTLH